MPLESRGEIRDAVYLADGIAASLRSRPAKFSTIRQAAASEAARYKRLGVGTPQAGREMREDGGHDAVTVVPHPVGRARPAYFGSNFRFTPVPQAATLLLLGLLD